MQCRWPAHHPRQCDLQKGTTKMATSGLKIDTTPQIAVVGAGTMGTAMARCLLDAGLKVGVWSRHPDSTMALVEYGATAYDQASDAVRDADVVVSMLAT